MIPWSLKWVPVNEMTAVLNIVAQKKPIAEKQWVRIKRGLYKGDLGRVELVMDSGAKVRDHAYMQCCMLFAHAKSCFFLT